MSIAFSYPAGNANLKINLHFSNGAYHVELLDLDKPIGPQIADRPADSKLIYSTNLEVTECIPFVMKAGGGVPECVAPETGDAPK